MSALNTTNNKPGSSGRVRMLTTTAMLGAFAGVLMLIEFPLSFIAPSFYKIDLSEIPVMIGSFAFGPVQGVVIELIKILIHLIFKGTATGGVGELANFIIGCAMVIPASIIYKVKKTKKAAVLGMCVSTLLMAVVGVFLNAYVMIPLYSKFMPLDMIIEAGKTIFPVINDTFTFCLCCVLPFNLIKGILVCVVVTLIYKPLSRLIHSTPEKKENSTAYIFECIASFLVPLAGFIIGGVLLGKKKDKEGGKMCIVLAILSTLLYAGIVVGLVVLNN